jgi:hypothetical protein
MMHDPVRLGLPSWVRVYTAVFAMIWCGFLSFVAISLALGGSPAALVPIVMLALGLRSSATTPAMPVHSCRWVAAA